MIAGHSIWAVIPASGSGSRMGGDRPKQYLTLHHKTVLEHCLDRLLSHPQIEGAVLVLSEEDQYWEGLEYQSEKPILIANGGEQRHHSVYNGLVQLQYRFGSESLVLVHDAARPLVTHQELSDVIAAASEHQAGAILALPVNDSLKLENDNFEIAASVSRDRLWRAQTPQAFYLLPLLNALEKVVTQGLTITDDASAISRM
ncbi:MAG: 2-C-methyl-D-erythritol 4-phosphate cytidylyltransferase, partial [Gammaproteobacteria bacterium]